MKEFTLTVLAIALPVAISWPSHEAARDHSKLKYLAYIKPDTREYCEKYAREHRNNMYPYGADASEIVQIEECVTTLDPEGVAKARKEL